LTVAVALLAEADPIVGAWGTVVAVIADVKDEGFVGSTLLTATTLNV
jgi:hypothetical protein